MKFKNECMKRVWMSVIAVLAIAMVWGSAMFPARAAEQSTGRMNVVFVVDGSGSMVTTDKNKLRYEAIELFLGLSAEQGNYMGAVVFNEDIILQKDITEMYDRYGKNQLLQSLREAPVTRDTDIGRAIYTATDMLQKTGNSSLDSAIILLTDGNTDLNSQAALDESASLKQKAIDDARSKGIKIYGICLNANGKASLEEVKEISDATGGASVEVKSAEDLKKVFEMFYGIIFDTDTIPIPVPEPDENGNLNVQFEIPDIGVEEANIIVNTLSKKVAYTLQRPNGNAVTADELEQMEIKAQTFRVIKIPSPEGGMWGLQISGVSRDEVEINMVYNSNLKLELINTDGKGSVAMRDTVKFSTKMNNNGAPVTDSSVFGKYAVKLEIVDANGNVRTENTTVNGTVCDADVTFDQLGEFDITAYVEISGKKKYSNTAHVSVGNNAPVAQNVKIKKVKFIGTKPAEIDLSSIAYDLEDTTLSYKIDGSDLESGTVNLQGDVLVVDVANSGSGDVRMTATDSAGASVSFTVTVKVVNLLLISLIVLIVIVVLVASVRLKKWWDRAHALINGNLDIQAFNPEAGRVTETVNGNKGTMCIAHEVMNLTSVRTGIDLRQCFIKAGDTDSVIIFFSKKPFFNEYGESRKEIELPSLSYINIYPDPEDKSTGLSLCYKQEQSFGGSSDFGSSGSGFSGW